MHFKFDKSMLMKTGDSSFESETDSFRLKLHQNKSKKYSNAQVDDYRNLKRKDFIWSPPLHLKLKARTVIDINNSSTDKLIGTAGFGFWNDPFMMTGLRSPALPRALWFFYSSKPSLLYLDEKQAYNDWQAMSIDANNPRFISMLPLLGLGFPLFNFSKIRNFVWPKVKKAFKGSQQNIQLNFNQWHDYEIIWNVKSVTFLIDGNIIHYTEQSPIGPMGLVIWIDNQYLILKPTGRFGFGNLEVPYEQSLEIKNLSIQKLN
jgi:hypothetical protein